MIRVASLHVYPLKGGRAIDLEQVEVDALGPRDDRRWMVVDPAGDLITQREVARLCQVEAVPGRDRLTLAAPDTAPLEIPRPDRAEARRAVRVWDDTVQAIDQGDPAAQWLSAFLGVASRLVYFPPDFHRPTDPDYDRLGGRVGFADGFPLLVAGQSSLEELNRRLEVPLPMNRFRPNVVVTGTEPFAEDGWRRFAIGGIWFDAVKPCARCTVTTTDQHTGERGVEPLKTLATFRKRGSGVMFGVNAVHRGTGPLRVGDPVTLA